MHATAFKCHSCGKTYPPDQIKYRCDCGGPLDIDYDYSTISDTVNWETFKRRGFDHNRYRELYPVINSDHRISLGEGGTPLLKADQLGNELGLNDLYLKIEGMNPTGTFKDRGTAVEIGKALDHNADEIVVASTGNMGASIAAYTARAGIETTIYVPKDVTEGKLRQMQAFDATNIGVGGGYTRAAGKAKQHHEKQGAYLMGDYAYRGEGEKSVGYELQDQITPDTVTMPVGNGTLMHGTWKGLKELETIGLTDTTPRMVGIQADGCSPVADAYRQNKDRITPAETADTEAGAIACSDPIDGSFALEAIHESNGFADSLPDSSLREAQKMLARHEGIYAELTCGAALAGIIANRDKFEEDETVVCIVTGTGLKEDTRINGGPNA